MSILKLELNRRFQLEPTPVICCSAISDQWGALLVSSSSRLVSAAAKLCSQSNLLLGIAGKSPVFVFFLNLEGEPVHNRLITGRR
jgi:hypothetical protein